MNGPKSGMCRGDDLPRMHSLCPGTFTRGAGEMEQSRELTCYCDCHYQDTTLARIIRRGAQGLRPAAGRPS